MTIYDRLGLIDHFFILLNISLQEVLRANVDWDESVPENLLDKWRDWLSLLSELEKLRVPRCYQHLVSPVETNGIEMHVFLCQ